tara:strand:+ start:555 stop:938 length:384 start_codon:yes stop_codon:yes gene_type:complete
VKSKVINMDRRIRNLTYDELKSIVKTFDWSNQAIKKIKLAINACDNIVLEKDKRFRFWQTIYAVLWENNEAVDMGFKAYTKKYFYERLEAIQYHNKNCNSYCKVCEILDRWNNERKESRIYRECVVV